ncbi:MAG: mRNA turnover and ribosome assembly protein [Tremellales sp. Tagirdzhanova-0007]|nr:MAG: mRNA turnover and ribosome assembly protein [Tremellales sp. Tagirdzhanova-0007]
MPKSKRAKVTTLSKTPVRSTKASKTALVDKLRSELDRFDHVWLFSVGDMRNEGLKQVRAQWKDTGRLFFSKGKIMAKALGDSPELEYQEGLSGIASLLRGPVGLFLTSHPVDDTVEWFDTWSKPEYARLGAIASRDVTLPAGPLLTPYAEPPVGDPFPHSMDPQLRALGLATNLVRGVPSLNNPHSLCRKGEKLSSEKCRILKLLGIQMAEFRIHLGSHWSRGQGFKQGADLSAQSGDHEAADGDLDEE